MSAECDIAAKVLQAKALRDQAKAIREEIKADCREIELPFTVVLDGFAVTVKPGYKPYYHRDTETPPVCTVNKVKETCDVVQR